MKEIKFDLRIGSCLNVLRDLPDNYFHTCVTSPPYWGLRDYGTGDWIGGNKNCEHEGYVLGNNRNFIDKDGRGGNNKALSSGICKKCGAKKEDQQIGLEETPEEYVTRLVEVFKQVWRVLRDDGTVWLNLGDSYYNYRPSLGQSMPKQTVSKTEQDLPQSNPRRANKIKRLKEKDLVGIPWRVALALQEYGWYLRQDIIWHKPNPMPESVKDRCTKSHEYIFLLSKKPHYYFDSDAIKEEAVGERWGGNTPINKENSKDKDGVFSGLTRERQMLSETRNKRSVWSVCPSAYKEAHFAVFPEELITPCILSGSPEYGNVLDPFGGSGTVGLACKRHKRNVTLIELNPKYEKFIRSRYKEPVQDNLLFPR